MAVNYDVYGRSEQWTDCYFNDKFRKSKRAYFGNGKTTLSEGVTAGKLDYTRPIDNSISFAGLGTECALSHIHYVGYKDNNIYEYGVNNRTVTNFGFFQVSTTNSKDPNYAQGYKLDRIKQIWGWQENVDDSRNYNKILEPMTKVDPKSMVLLIKVEACGDPYGNVWGGDFSEWLNVRSTYPNIVRAYIVPYYNYNGTSGQSISAPERSTTGVYPNSGAGDGRRPFVLGLLDPYTIDSHSFEMYGYALSYMPVFGNFINRTMIPTYYDTNYMIFCAVPESAQTHHIKRYDNYDGTIISYIEGYTELPEDILKTVACFGLYFTTKTSVAETGNFTNNDMYIGILDSQGVGHGQYFRGADTVRAPQSSDDITDMHQLGYDPTLPYIDYDTNSHYGTASYYNFNKMYSITGAQVQRLAQILSTAMSDKPASMSESDYSTGTFLTNNPIDCIVSLRKYPIVSTSNSEAIHDIYFGGYKSSLSAPYANNVQIINYSFTGEKAFISAFGGSFLDREPYTSAELYVPFCGNVKLKVDEWIDHALTVRLIVDYLTGSCTAYIERDGIPRITISGDIGIDVPVTGVQSQTLANTIMRNNANLRSAQISVVQSASGAAISGTGDNPLQLVSSAINLVNRSGNIEKALNNRDITSYALHHTEIPYKSVSSGDPVTAGYGEWRCRLSITRPVLSPDFDPETYGKTIGYACLKQGKVSDFTGLTVGTIDLTGINAPAEVKNMIQTAFSKGVYL